MHARARPMPTRSANEVMKVCRYMSGRMCPKPDPGEREMHAVAQMFGKPLEILTCRVLALDPVRFLVAGGFASAVNWLVGLSLSAFLRFDAAVAIAYMIGM